MIPIKDICLITFQSKNRHAQPENLPKNDLVWTSNQRIRIYGQYFARQVLIRFSINPAEVVELIIANMPMQYFSGKIFIEEKRKAIEKAQKTRSTLLFGVTDLS